MSRIDPFYYKQPPLSFVDELKKEIHLKKPKWFNRVSARQGEVSVGGAFLDIYFVDEKNVLKTAYDDFKRFAEVFKLGGNSFPIRIVYEETDCFESYKITVNQNECVVSAADTEGIRRALIYIEDELMRRNGAFLPLGEICRKPKIRTRITRGFFSPTNRAPKYGDELFDDIDYYPKEYLNRLAHDGTNGLWISVKFSDILPSDYFPEYGKGWEKRIEKLNRVIKRCADYGIKVYLFFIEPAALRGEMTEKYTDVLGAHTWSGHAFCTYTERGEQYCIEAMQKLFENVPDLGGCICITQGERLTSCASMKADTECPHCGKYSCGKVLAHTVDLLKEGMRRANSKADFISWTYGHRDWNFEDVEEYVKLAPEDAVFMQNFEDLGYCEQLGKTRLAIDYWLSYVGPSDLYEFTSGCAKKYNKQLFAKMQVCCSHELASVPYIPVPGILFDKYAAAIECKTEGIVQCWYFGNYPSLMSKAAGELAFADNFTNKTAFIKNLAGIYYSEKNTERACRAWECFETAYKNYPVNIMFSYYGPMHDGVVWELSLKPKNKALPRSWMLLDEPSGDRIGECLQSGHTLNEAITLLGNMQENWSKGLSFLPRYESEEQYRIAEALGILFSSGKNILNFYYLREQLAIGGEDALNILNTMRGLVECEIKNSSKMIELCNKDSRLGYHSEAEGYKFFPEKLNWRINLLKELLLTEFAEVESRIAKKETALEYYLGEREKAYIISSDKTENAEWQNFCNNEAAFKMFGDENYLYLEVKSKRKGEVSLCFEFRLMWPSPEILISDGKIRLTNEILHQSVFGNKKQAELDKYLIETVVGDSLYYRIRIDRKKCGWKNNRPAKMRIALDGISWIKEDEPVRSLGKAALSPGEFGWIMTE